MFKKLKKVDKSLIMSLVMLLLVILVFEILTKGKLLQKRNLLNLINQSLTIIMAGLGMIFVVSMGGTDITTGVVAALAGIAAAAIASNHFLLAFPVAIVIGMIFGLTLGIINVIFKVPSFMASLAILIAGRAAITWLMSTYLVFAPVKIMALNNFEYKIPILIFLIVLVVYLLEYTPFGNYVKAIGENENAAAYLGINVKKIKMTAFMLSGIMAGFAGIFVIARSGGASPTTASGMEMNVMMAIFVGGVPVTGGTASKIYKLICGALLIAVLENGLILGGSSGALTQLIKGIVLILVVYLTMFLNKTTINDKAVKKLA